MIFWTRLAMSIADAIYWVIIIFALGFTIWFLGKSFIDFLLEDVDKKNKDEKRKEEEEGV